MNEWIHSYVNSWNNVFDHCVDFPIAWQGFDFFVFIEDNENGLGAYCLPKFDNISSKILSLKTFSRFKCIWACTVRSRIYWCYAGLKQLIAVLCHHIAIKMMIQHILGLSQHLIERLSIWLVLFGHLGNIAGLLFAVPQRHVWCGLVLRHATIYQQQPCSEQLRQEVL